MTLLNEKLRSAGCVSVSHDETPELQDDLVKMTLNEVSELWSTLERPARRILIWVAFKVLDEDSAIGILKATVMLDLERNAEASFSEMYKADWEAIATARREVQADKERLADVCLAHTEMTTELDGALAEISRLRRANEALEDRLEKKREEGEHNAHAAYILREMANWTAKDKS